MQISRHWRMNSLRYRLQGVRLQNGQVSLQARQQYEGGSVVARAVIDRVAQSSSVTTPEGLRRGKEVKAV